MSEDTAKPVPRGKPSCDGRFVWQAALRLIAASEVNPTNKPVRSLSSFSNFSSVPPTGPKPTSAHFASVPSTSVVKDGKFDLFPKMHR